MSTPTKDQSWCEVGNHQYCTGYTEDEMDPETCFCGCHSPEDESTTSTPDESSGSKPTPPLHVDEVLEHWIANHKHRHACHDGGVDNCQECWDYARRCPVDTAFLLNEVEQRGEQVERLSKRLERSERGWSRLRHRADAAEAKVALLLSALNVALNDDDPDALQGAQMTLEEIHEQDLTLLIERDALAAKVTAVEAALNKAEELPDAGPLYHVVEYREGVETTVERVRAALRGASDG